MNKKIFKINFILAALFCLLFLYSAAQAVIVHVPLNGWMLDQREEVTPQWVRELANTGRFEIRGNYLSGGVSHQFVVFVIGGRYYVLDQDEDFHELNLSEAGRAAEMHKILNELSKDLHKTLQKYFEPQIMPQAQWLVPSLQTLEMADPRFEQHGVFRADFAQQIGVNPEHLELLFNDYLAGKYWAKQRNLPRGMHEVFKEFSWPDIFTMWHNFITRQGKTPLERQTAVYRLLSRRMHAISGGLLPQSESAYQEYELRWLARNRHVYVVPETPDQIKSELRLRQQQWNEVYEAINQLMQNYNKLTAEKPEETIKLFNVLLNQLARQKGFEGFGGIELEKMRYLLYSAQVFIQMPHQNLTGHARTVLKGMWQRRGDVSPKELLAQFNAGIPNLPAGEPDNIIYLVKLYNSVTEEILPPPYDPPVFDISGAGDSRASPEFLRLEDAGAGDRKIPDKELLE